MMASRSQQGQILLSLAEEIRQVIGWLSIHETPPPAVEIRLRIRMLREAATVVGMRSAESPLEKLEEDLNRQDAQPDTRRVLEELASLIASIAASAEKREREWVEQVQNVQLELARVAEELHQCTTRLKNKMLLIDSCAKATSGPERAGLLTELFQDVRQISSRQRSLRRSLLASSTGLRDISRNLVRELSTATRVPLVAVLFGLKDQIGQLGKSQGKPVTLHLRCGETEVSRRQIDPVLRLLETFAGLALREGIESPEQRRKVAKPTVGNLWISGTRDRSLVEIRLEDDGHPERADIRLTRRDKEDLRSLRARLIRETSRDSGQSLVLQIPSWYNTVEVLPVKTSAFEALVPLYVVAEVLRDIDVSQSDVPLIHLDRRGRGSTGPENRTGLLLEVHQWRGKLNADILGTHFRAVPLPPAPEDPPWIIARIESGNGSRPLIHPLPLMDVQPDQECLFPPVQ